MPSYRFIIMSPAAFNPNGWMADFWIAGSMTLTLAVFVANFKILLFSSKNSVLSISIIIGSILVYFISFIILNIYETSDLYAILTMYATYKIII